MTVRIGQDTMTVREAIIAACVWAGCVVALIVLALFALVLLPALLVSSFFTFFGRVKK